MRGRPIFQKYRGNNDNRDTIMSEKILSPEPEDNPEIYDDVPDLKSDSLTDYDKRNLKTYLRLLDAEQDNMPWEEAVRLILKRDPDSNRLKVKNTWDQHMERAMWMTEHGWRELADNPAELLEKLKKG